MGTLREWQLFLMGILWGLILFKLLPMLVKDVVEMFKENKKSSTAGTAEQIIKKHSKYIITDSYKDFHNLKIERWR